MDILASKEEPTIKDRVIRLIRLNYKGFIKSEDFTDYLSLVIEELGKRGDDATIYSNLLNSSGNERISVLADIVLSERESESEDTDLKRLIGHSLGNLITNIQSILFVNHRDQSAQIAETFNKL